jgi:cytochrome o ubiquinol oxidase subunit 2
MKKHRKLAVGIAVVVVAIISIAGWYLHRHTISILQPAGEIGYKERDLIVFTALLSLVVVIPVFFLLGYIAWKYREDNHTAKYSPDLEGNKVAELVWWLIPAAIICILATVTWRTTYALNPFKPIASKKPVLHVQVIALDWKWLFIYPGQNVASVNEAAVPVNTPVDFELTSDTVMASFWDPQLGSQMYVMPGMDTQLNLMANKTGSFNGESANITGDGFNGQTFVVKSMSQSSFNTWIASAKRSKQSLNQYGYDALARPSSNVRPEYYNSATSGLYDTIIMKYMMPTGTGSANNTGVDGS